MRIGILQGADGTNATVDEIVKIAKKAEEIGLDSLWSTDIRTTDAISALTVAGTETSKIELGTAVTPIQARHPMALAQQAMTAAQVCEGRFTLGLGVSHRIVIEDVLGLSYAQPALYMKEYLEVLLPLLRNEAVSYNGKFFKVANLQTLVTEVINLPVVIAALGPTMLQLAGKMSAGTSTWMVGPKTLQSYMIKRIQKAALGANRPKVRIIAAFPLILTNHPETVRARLAKRLKKYGELPSYRAMLEREGVSNPADLALIGDENELRARIEVIQSIGVTDFSAAIMPVEKKEDFDRSLAFLGALKT